jgi:PAS domain S-box-containing protein
MDPKERYVKEQISLRLQSWISAMLLLGIVFFPFIGIADYFVTPENLGKFAVYRLTISVILAFFYYLNKRHRSTRYQYALITVATLLAAAVIEAMILQFGGHRSSYYAGLSLLIIAALGLIPYGFLLSLSVGIAIYGIYLFPILLLDTITDPAAFVANNIFMICTFVLALTWRTLIQKSMINELRLQYDLREEKRQLEELVVALNRSEQRHRSLFENATDGIIVLDGRGIVTDANDRACSMHGYERRELLGVPVLRLEDDAGKSDMLERMRRILAGEALVFETRHVRKDGSTIDLEISSKAVIVGGELFIQSFYRDITEKKKIQEHLFQSQKMDSIGALAGGVAHDFNNVLTAILGHTEIIRRTGTLHDHSLRSLTGIEDASFKAGRMIAKLLGFARKGEAELAPLNMNDAIYDTVKLLEQVLDKRISLSIDLAPDVPQVRGDINLLEQAVMNLIVNARDAMPAGGCITVRTEARTVSRGAPDVPPYVPPGDYVVIRIADTGTGIPPEIQDKIFEPFFTTKERGRGTGLGLASVYGTVKKHQGYITVQSVMGTGTTFTLYLPAAPSPRPDGSAGAAPSGTETVLIVDDEEDILHAMRDSLEARGYRVLAASDPSQALELFRAHAVDTSLVITDIVMPRMNGKELIRRIRDLSPTVKILAASGYTNYVAEKEDIKEINGFLQKPFEPAHLLAVVRRTLDAAPQQGISA